MIKNKKIRFRKCKAPECGEKFKVNPYKPLIPVCSVPCAIAYQKLLKANKEAKDWKEKKIVMVEKLMTHKDYLKLLQVVFNTFIRTRDKGLGCVSCGRKDVEEFHAGHYIATTYQFLRFNELNCWLQCSQCNTHLRGNSIPYRIELIKRIGLQEVEKLENSRHNDFKLSIPEIKDLIILYKNKIKALNN